MYRATTTANFNRHYCRRENNVSIRWKPPSSNCTNAVSRRVKLQSLSSRCMAITTRRQPSPRLQRMSRIRLSSFIADRLPSDILSSFVTRCMSISAATAWPRRLSTSRLGWSCRPPERGTKRVPTCQTPELLSSSYACGKPPGATFRPEGRPGCA